MSSRRTSNNNLPERLKSSRAWELRESEALSVKVRLVEYMELSSLYVAPRRRLMTEAEIADPRANPRITTTLAYWGIRNKSDWEKWMSHELTKFALVKATEVKENLDSVKQAGWGSCARALEDVISMYEARGLA